MKELPYELGSLGFGAATGLRQDVHGHVLFGAWVGRSRTAHGVPSCCSDTLIQFELPFSLRGVDETKRVLVVLWARRV